MWMNFNTFPSSSGVNCVIRINSALVQFIKIGKCYHVNNLNP